MIYVFFAPGFEEIEAIATVDMLRRAQLAVTTVGIGAKTVTGSHGITIVCDKSGDALDISDCSAVVLPGGMPGTNNLEQSPLVQSCLEQASQRGAWICAICAAPLILGHKNLLQGRRATCYPGYEQELYGAEATGDAVCTDNNIITGKGAGAVFNFAAAIIAALRGSEAAAEIKEGMQCPDAC